MGAFFTNLAHPTLFGFDEDRLSALEERFGGTIDNQLLHVLAGRGLVGVACLLALLFTPIVIWLRLLPGSRAAPYAFVLPAYLLLAASDVAFFGLFTAFVWVAAVVAWPAVRDLAAERSAADDG
jgi:O-antigen ligase